MNKIFYERPRHLQNREPKQGQNQPQIQEQYNQSINQVQDDFVQEKSLPVKRGIKELIANGILIVLSILLVNNVFGAITVIKDMNPYDVKEEDRFWLNIEAGDYTSLIMNTWTNRFSDVKETDGLKQCYAVAEYYEAAVLYKAADYTGNIEKKEKYAGIMEEKLDYFYDIMYIAEDINMKLGIE